MEIVYLMFAFFGGEQVGLEKRFAGVGTVDVLWLRGSAGPHGTGLWEQVGLLGLPAGVGMIS